MRQRAFGGAIAALLSCLTVACGSSPASPLAPPVATHTLEVTPSSSCPGGMGGLFDQNTYPTYTFEMGRWGGTGFVLRLLNTPNPTGANIGDTMLTLTADSAGASVTGTLTGSGGTSDGTHHVGFYGRTSPGQDPQLASLAAIGRLDETVIAGTMRGCISMYLAKYTKVGGGCCADDNAWRLTATGLRPK